MEELVQLRLDVDQLKNELREQPSFRDCDDCESLKLRRELQIQLESKVLRLAELEEMDRIQALTQSSVESGLVVTPVDLERSGECPLCLENLSVVADQTAMPCCGAVFCHECKATNRSRQESVIHQYYATDNLTQKEQFKAELDMLQRCSFAASPVAMTSTRHPSCAAMLNKARPGLKLVWENASNKVY
jgi:hypothetical protein